jgi:hypothetical protein
MATGRLALSLRTLSVHRGMSRARLRMVLENRIRGLPLVDEEVHVTVITLETDVLKNHLELACAPQNLTPHRQKQR